MLNVHAFDVRVNEHMFVYAHKHSSVQHTVQHSAELN